MTAKTLNFNENIEISPECPSYNFQMSPGDESSYIGLSNYAWIQENTNTGTNSIPNTGMDITYGATIPLGGYFAKRIMCSQTEYFFLLVC